MKVNEKIRVFRENQHLTQEEMATKLSLSTNGYANIERGETKLTFERLEQIANILGLDVTELISYGESHTIMYHHSTNNLNIIGNSSDNILELEISKLQMMLGHKDELLVQKEREIEALKLLVETLRSK